MLDMQNFVCILLLISTFHTIAWYIEHTRKNNPSKKMYLKFNYCYYKFLTQKKIQQTIPMFVL